MGKVILVIIGVPFAIYYGALLFFRMMELQIGFEMDHPTMTLWGPSMMQVLAIALVLRFLYLRVAPKKKG